MTLFEVLQFAAAVPLAAGVVTMVNVVLSRLRDRSGPRRGGGNLRQ